MAKLNTDSATKLYNAVKDAGFDIGDYNAYMTKLQSDPTNADNLYKALHGAGFDIGNDYASKLYSNATPLPNLFDFGKKPDVTIPNAGNGYSFLEPRAKSQGSRVRGQESVQPLTDEEAQKVIYGNVPGTTKIGDVSFLPTGGGYQNTKGKATVQKPNTDVQVAVPGQSVYGNAPQVKMPTITSEDIEKQAQADLQKQYAGNEYEQAMFKQAQDISKGVTDQEFNPQFYADIPRGAVNATVGIAGSTLTGVGDLYDKAGSLSGIDFYADYGKKLKELGGKADKYVKQHSTGSAGEQFGGMLPMAAMAVGDVASGGSLTPLITGTFAASGYGDGIKMYDELHPNGDGNEYAKTGAGLLYGAVMAGAGNYLMGKAIPKGLISEAVQNVFRSNPELLQTGGEAIVNAFAKQQPTLLKQLATNAGHSVMSMEAMELGKKGIDELYGKHSDVKDWINTATHAAVTGVVFSALTAPFSIHAQSAANTARREAQGNVTLTFDGKGKPVEVIEGLRGLTPEGKEVKLTQENVNNSFTMTTDDFNRFMAEKGNAQVNEREVFSNNVADTLKRMSGNGNVSVARDEEGNALYVVGQQDGKLMGFDVEGQVRPIPEGADIQTAPIADVHSAIMNEYDKKSKTGDFGDNVDGNQPALEAIQPAKPNAEEVLRNATADATNFVEAITHAESGNVIEARLHGVDKPINITKGNVVLKEDGSVDVENSDKTFFYKTPDGVLHVGNIEFIEGINSVVPAQEAIDKSVQPVRDQLENANAPEYGIGKKAVIVDNTDPQNPSNAIVTITGKDENGNYKVQRDMGNGQVQPGIVQPREILPQFAGVLDTENAAVDYIDPQTGETMTGMLELDTPDKQMMFANGYATIDGKQIPFENVIESQEPRAKSQETPKSPQGDLNTQDNETNGLQAAEAGNAQSELGQGGNGTGVQETDNGQQTTDNGQETDKSPEGDLPLTPKGEQEIPQDEKGNLLFEQARPEVTVQFLKDNFEPEEIVPTVVARINAINKEITKQEAFKPTGNIQKDALVKQAKRQALNTLNEQLGYWKDIQEQVTPRNYKPQNETVAQRDARWGEPTSLREMIIRKFIGGVKLRWDDEKSADGTVISRGLGGEYRYSNDERKSHISFISSNGVTPEQLAHSLWQANAYEPGQFEDMPLYGMDTQDILNEILDVMNSYRSTGEMIKSVDEIRDQYTSQEQDYIDALVASEENQKNVQEIVHNEMDDTTFAELAGLVNLTEEQQNELNNLQNDVTNTGTTETTIGSDSAGSSQQPGEEKQGDTRAIANGAADAGGNQSGDGGFETVDEKQPLTPKGEHAPKSPEGDLSQEQLDTQELDANKQPWKMTRNEFIEQSKKNAINEQSRENVALISGFTHRTSVFNALSEGKNVPDNVLNDYPGIKSEVEENNKRLLQIENWKKEHEKIISDAKLQREQEEKQREQEDKDKRFNYLINTKLKDLILKSGYKTNRTGTHDLIRFNQEEAIKQALQEGIQVPNEVLSDYPELQAQRDTQELDANIASQEHNTNPTDKQKETGIYPKARVNLQGFNITLETLKGTERSGIDEGGQKWSVTMHNHYGELDGTTGYDGDPIDVFIGPNPKEGGIWVVDQQTPASTTLSKQFDESKVMLGFDSAEEAKAAYLSNYEPGWDGFGTITPAGDNFKEWLYDGKKQRKPFSEYKDTPESIEIARNEENLAIPETFTVSSFNEFEKQFNDGKITLDAYKKAFEVLRNSKDTIVSELNSKTKDELIKMLNSWSRYGTKSEKKDRIVTAIYDDMLMTFTFGSIEYDFSTPKDVMIARKVAKSTQADIDNHVSEVRRQREAYIKRVEEYKKALTNPETLSEFKIFIDKNGIDKLSLEQKAKYDELVTDRTQETRKKTQETQVDTSKVDGISMSDVIESKHTKTGEPLYVVKLNDRVEKETYYELNNIAKKLGGGYSSYNKDGAIPGFHFKTREAAEKFRGNQAKEVSTTNETIQEVKTQNKVSKLRDNATKMIESADAELNRERLTNTSKRAAEASRMDDRANEQKRIAQTMLNIADAIDRGDVKLLDGINAKTHIQLLDNLIQQAKYAELNDKYKDYSERLKHQGESATLETIEYLRGGYYPSIYASRLKDLINGSLEKTGVKRIASQWQKITSKLGDHGNYQLKSDKEVQEVQEMLDASKEKYFFDQIKESIANHKRLKVMGIENDSMLRSALREYIQYRGVKGQVDKVKQLERDLVGKNVGIDFFPTPKKVVSEMLDYADIQPGMNVLEPSAGNGNIADAIKEEGIKADVIEISNPLREILEAKGYNLVGTDFMTFTDQKYDRIIMNPPFGTSADIDHVMHAYELLKPNGRIVAIMSEGTFFRNDSKSVKFREFLDNTGSETIDVEAGAFNDKTLLNTTGVKTRIVVIDKNDAAFQIKTENFDTAKTSEEKYTSGKAIIDQLDADGGRETVVAKDNKDFAAMLPAKYEQLVMTRNIGGVYFKGGVIINVDKHDSTDSVLAAYEHEYAHKATREIHSNEQLADMWVNSSESDKQLLRSAYADNPDWVKGDELISLAVEDIIEKQGYENYKSGNIDLSSYSETLQEPLQKTIKYANKEYLDNLRRRNGGGNAPSGDHAGKGIGDLRDTGDGRSASALGREDNGAAGQSQSDVSGAVSGRSEGILQSPLNPPKGDLPLAPKGEQEILPATIEVDGVERSTTNSLGQQIHLTEAGVRNFWKWFGNSKVVDKQGRPLVVYHGSISDFNEFKLIDSDVFGTKFGHFFTPDKDIAKSFADRAENGVLYATYLKLEHPKKINGFFWDSYSRYKGADASLRKQSPKEYKGNVELPDFKAFREQLQAEGNDGVVLNNISIQGEKTRIVNTPQYIVFEPTQIKSAIGNNGEFGADDADIRYQIIGEKGAGSLDASTSSATEATSRLDNLRVAKEMEAKAVDNGDGMDRGFTPQEIRLATGWEKGVDGLWRYEVPDGELAYGYYDLIQKGGMKRLPDVFENTEIFKAYPELNNIAVMTDNLGDIGGSYSNKVITLNRDMFGRVDMLSVIIHEIQHAIQEIEGFAKGGNPDKMGRYTIEENKKILEQKYSHLPSYKEAKENGELDKWVIDMVNATGTGITPHEAYRRLAGETEARNASARMNMSEEERRNILLAETADVAPEDQIVLMDGLGVSNLTPPPAGTPLEKGRTGEKLPATINVDGVERPTTNSNGKPIHGTEEGIKNFWKWFGDSKVVDGEGRPLVVYHGTDRNFNEFKIGSAPGWGNGIYFTDNYENANEFGDRIISAYLSLKKPVFENKIGTYENEVINTNAWKNEEKVKQEKYDDEEYTIDYLNRISEDFSLANKAFRELKYDGIIASDSNNINGQEIVAFSPNQIKFAIGNNGEFDPEDADIRFQIQTPKSPKGDLPATINVDGVERPTTNSNGKPIHGTEEGIKNFWKWFGNSKVVDKDGRPLVVYHATQSDFNEFSKNKIGKSIDFGTLGTGFYFTDSSENASNYARNLNTNTGKNGNESIMPVYLSIDNPYDADKLFEVKGDSKKESDKFNSKLKSKGFDGAKFEWRRDLVWYVAFYPSQIKSATGNSGEFDPEDSDIRFQIQGYKGSRTTPEYYKQAQSLDDLFGIGKPVHDKKGGEPISEYYKRVKAWSVANNPQSWGEADRQEAADYIAGITPDSYEAKAQAAQAAAQAAGATVVDEPKPVFQQDGHTAESVSDFARRVVAWREERFINGLVRAEREAEARESVAQGFTPIDHETARMELDMQLRTVYDSLGKLIGKQPAKKLERWAGNKEMWADSLLPVKTFLDYLRSRGVKIPDIDDYYLQATALQGKNDTGFNNYVRKYQKPVNKWIHDTMKATGFNYRDIENYVFLKHGVERNEFFKKDGKHQKADYAGVYAIATELYAKDNGIPFDPKEKNEIGKVLKEYANANGITLNETSESGIYDELFANKKEAVEQAQVEKNRGFFDKIVTDYINNFESESNSKGQSIDDFWAKLNDANNFSLDVMADAGIITRTQADEIKSRYQYFIPLRGHEVEAEKTYEYSPDAGVFFSNPAIKAHGRISRAEHPFSYIAQMAQSAVVMKNNNDLKKTMLRLARKDKTGMFSVNRTWYIKTGTDAEGMDIWEEAEIEAKPSDELNRAEWEAWNERMKELEKEGRAKQFTKGVDLDGLFIKKKQKKQHAITIIENGEEYQVYINANPRISRGINGLNKSEQDKVMRFLSSIKGTIGLNMTSRNPAFMAANFSRDVIFAASILPAKEGGAYAAQFLSNIPVAAKELIQYQINPDNAPQHVQEFLDNGGETGYSHLWELQDMQKQIDKAVAQGMSVSKAWDALVMPIDVMNKIVENTTRLAVYKTSRESGRTVERSVNDAKEVSLNFNKTGAGGGIVDYVRGAYLFVNAGVQALNNFTKVYKEHPVKMTGVVMSYIMSGLLMSLINALAGDDGEYWNLPEYERQNNLCIWVGSGFVKIPLPQELRVFHRMGDNVAAHLWNKKLMGEAVVNVGAGFLDLIPANPSGPITDSWAEAMPDALKPFAQVWANKTFTGAAIAKDESFMKEGVPQWRQVRTNRANEPKSPAGIIWLSAELNAALGGDQYRSAGAFEKAVLNPDKLNHLARGYFGGVYTTATQGLGTISDRFYMPEKDLEEKTTGSGLQNAYNKIDKAEQQVNQFNQMVEDLKQNKIDRVQFAKDTLGTNYGEAKRIQKLGSRLREINKVLKENQDLPEEEKKKLLEAQKTILRLIDN